MSARSVRAGVVDGQDAVLARKDCHVEIGAAVTNIKILARTEVLRRPGTVPKHFWVPEVHSKRIELGARCNARHELAQVRVGCAHGHALMLRCSLLARDVAQAK